MIDARCANRNPPDRETRPPPGSHPRPMMTGSAHFAGLYGLMPSVGNALRILKPATVIAWHRAGFRAFWRWKSRPCGGRPQASSEVRELIREMLIGQPGEPPGCRRRGPLIWSPTAGPSEIGAPLLATG